MQIIFKECEYRGIVLLERIVFFFVTLDIELKVLVATWTSDMPELEHKQAVGIHFKISKLYLSTTSHLTA